MYFSPLFLAAQKGHINIIEMLIEKCIPVEEKNIDGHTPLSLAIQHDRHYATDFLTEILNNNKQNNSANEILQENYSNKDPCIICLAPRNGLYVLLPCGHVSLCKLCTIKISCQGPNANCPSCRSPITDYKKIFIQVPE